MKTTSHARPSFLKKKWGKRGSATLIALGIVAVTLTVLSTTLIEASHRYRTSGHSLRWAQAGQAAEAGADITMLTAKNGSWTADGWSSAPGNPGAAAISKTFTLDSAGGITAVVTVDKVAVGSNNWLRIRSTGKATLYGGAISGVDENDVALRKVSLRTDRTTGAALSAPQSTRTVEILGKPGSIFTGALLLNKKFNMSGGGVIDSFDSSDPTKSTNGLYDITKRQSNGNIGDNDTQGASDLKSTYIYGNVSYSGPAIANTGNVQGTITTPFSKPTTDVAAPAWTSYNATPTVIGSSMTLTGGTQSSPALYKVSSVNVPGGKVLTLAPYASGQESYIEIWVTGDFTTSGSGYIVQQPGVHVTYHIEGDVTVSGSSFNNQSNLAANCSVELVTPPAGTTQKVTISGGGNFIGTMNAPAADFTISGSANFSGAMIGKTMLISGGASLHYDEGLMNSGSGGGAYTFASEVEAVR